MCRFVEEAEGKPKQVYGVLTDYDISSWTGSLNSDHTKTSQQWIGTPLYMAQELLDGRRPLHLYRHDVESLFYVMLLVSARYSIVPPQQQNQPRVVMRGSAGLPYDDWFNERCHHTLSCLKSSFLVGMCPIELSPDFKDFHPWLFGIQYWFSEGFKCRPPSKEGVPDWAIAMVGDDVEPAADPYDDETLGGYIEYAGILTAIPHLEGELESLVIRDPQHSSPPASPISVGTS